MKGHKLDSSSHVGNTNMRPLVIDDAARSLAQGICAFAAREENVYRPGGPVPGDNPLHFCHINTYRCVFSITETPGPDRQRFRHLSVSVPGTRWPNVAAVLMIAELFGFAGWDGKTLNRMPEGWLVGAHETERAVVVAQKL